MSQSFRVQIKRAAVVDIRLTRYDFDGEDGGVLDSFQRPGCGAGSYVNESILGTSTSDISQTCSIREGQAAGHQEAQKRQHRKERVNTGRGLVTAR